MKTQKELFYVTSIINNYEYRKAHFNNVKFVWFNNDRTEPSVPFELAIKDYKQHGPGAREMDGYADAMICELFTKEEATLLKEYLDGLEDPDIISTELDNVPLPIDNNMMGMGAIPVGGYCDFYMLSEHKDYTLPFKVWGYFDLREDTGCVVIQPGDADPSGYCPKCGHEAQMIYVEGLLFEIVCLDCDFHLHICDQFEKIYKNVPGIDQQCTYESW